MARRSFRITALILGGLGLTGLGACANFDSFETGALPVPPGSPVALAIADALNNPGPMPRFADVPKIPDNVPTAQARAESEQRVRAQGAELDRQIAALPPIDPAASSIAQSAALAVFEGIAPPTDAERAAFEAFARAARARATPPPAPK